MNSHLLMAIFLVAVVLLTGCRTLPDHTFSEAQADRAIENFMRCDECSGHQLYHVAVIGESARQKLELLQRDGSSAIPPHYAADLDDQWSTLFARYGRNLRMGQDAYRLTHLAAYKKRVEARAKIALDIVNKRWYSFGRSRRSVEP